MKVKWLDLTRFERDILVEESVMGLCVHQWEAVHEDDSSWEPDWQVRCVKCGKETSGAYGNLRPVSGKANPYTTDIAWAWEVVEKLGAKSLNAVAHKVGFATFTMARYPSGDWRASLVGHGAVAAAIAPTAPEAICIAALRACGVEVET